MAAAFGLAALIATSANAFSLIKWLGVAYLAWIGVQLFLSKPKEFQLAGSSRKTRTSLFKQGFITSSANPYAVIFFAALFPQFIDPALATLPQVTILGATYLLVDALLLLIWGNLAIYSADRLRAISSGLVNRICGLLMIGAAALLASKDFEPNTQSQ